MTKRASTFKENMARVIREMYIPKFARGSIKEAYRPVEAKPEHPAVTTVREFGPEASELHEVRVQHTTTYEVSILYTERLIQVSTYSTYEEARAAAVAISEAFSTPFAIGSR